MEDLQSLMACIDDISSKIPDGIYLDMADKMKRVHDHMNGNKPFHEDTFYYSDDDSELDSDDDSDSDYEMRSPVNAGEADREIRIENIRRHLLDCVRSMHQVWDEFEKWENELKRERARARPLITRMTMARKKLAIQRWCEKNASWAPGGEAGELVGCGPIVTGTNFWTWKNLVENGIRTIVLEIGTDDEKLLDFVCYDELSLETLQKLPAFEKKIYNDYKEECNRLHSIDATVPTWKMKHEEMMQTWEMRVQEQENKLRELDADVFARDSWDAENRIFWTNDEGQMVSNGWDARTEVRR
jgi:hypothetical protein